MIPWKVIQNGVRIWLQQLRLFGLVLLVTACPAQEPKMVGGITGVAYNYSQESFALAKINGKTVGTAMEKARLGAVVGGGGVCCIEIPIGAKTVEVTLDPANGDAVTVTAPIEKWWPDLASTAIVHILPRRKVVVEIRSYGIVPRRDLLAARIKELGLKREVESTGIWNTGPNARADGKE